MSWIIVSLSVAVVVLANIAAYRQDMRRGRAYRKPHDLAGRSVRGAAPSGDASRGAPAKSLSPCRFRRGTFRRYLNQINSR